MDLLHLWNQAGWFARGIIIILVLMSITSLTIAVAKWFRFRKMDRATAEFAPKFSEALEGDRVHEAIELTEQYKTSHVARVLGEALREVAPLLDDPRAGAAAITTAERAIEREQILLANELKAGMGVLATVGSTAPFVGLLGTTVGIVNAFEAIGRQGAGLESVATGIAEALITTAIGLLAAIPAVWLYNYFSTRLDTMFSELAAAGRELVDWLTHRHTQREIAGAVRNPAYSGD
jgi:biopolymer transport protein ExbB/biopolymer transport protein TolQ